jgi:hypothetical protein
MGAHNNGIIVNASTSIWQQEMNGNQPSAQPCSANPVDTSTHNDGIIVNESISIQQEKINCYSGNSAATFRDSA